MKEMEKNFPNLTYLHAYIKVKFNHGRTFCHIFTFLSIINFDLKSAMFITFPKISVNIFQKLYSFACCAHIIITQ